MNVSVLPLEWDKYPLRVFWRKQVTSDSLIPWTLAREYFRKPAAWIDYRNPQQPTITDREPQ